MKRDAQTGAFVSMFFHDRSIPFIELSAIIGLNRFDFESKFFLQCFQHLGCFITAVFVYQLFGRMLAKHLNSKKQKSVTDAGIGTVTANPVNAAAGNRTTDVGGSAYSSVDAAYKEKKTATGFPDESTRREIASMLDSNVCLRV